MSRETIPVHFFTQNGASVVYALKPNNTAAVDAVFTKTWGLFLILI